MTPYERTKNVTTTVASEIVVVEMPGRCTIDRVAVARLGGGAITADFYNRAFTGDDVDIRLFKNSVQDGNRVQLVLSSPVAFAVGDVVDVVDSPGTSPTGFYDGAQRIYRRIDDFNYILDTASSGVDDPGDGATIALAIPAEEQLLYKALPQLTGTAFAEALLTAVYHNQDPLPNLNRGVVRKIYVKLATADDYRISIRCHEDVGF